MTTPSLDNRPGTALVRALGVLAATLAPLAVWAVAVPLLGVDLRVATPGGVQAVGPVSIVAFALTVSLLGWALLALLERRARRAPAIWTAVAVILLLVSIGPLTGALTIGAGVTLALMHVLVAAVLIPTMRRTSRR